MTPEAVWTHGLVMYLLGAVTGAAVVIGVWVIL